MEVGTVLYRGKATVRRYIADLTVAVCAGAGDLVAKSQHGRVLRHQVAEEGGRHGQRRAGVAAGREAHPGAGHRRPTPVPRQSVRLPPDSGQRRTLQLAWGWCCICWKR